MTLFASLALLNSFEEESQRKWFAKLKVESEMGWNFFSAKDVHSNIKEQWYLIPLVVVLVLGKTTNFDFCKGYISVYIDACSLNSRAADDSR
jgi:hypothetical protein